MTASTNITTVTMEAGEDLSKGIYLAVAVNASGQVVKPTAINQPIIGNVAGNVPTAAAAGGAIPIVLTGTGGIANFIANDAVTAGELAISVAAGEGKITGVAGVANLPTTQHAFGIVLDSGVANQVVRVLMQPIASTQGN